MNKIEELIQATKLGELMHKKEAEKEKKNVICIAVVSAIAVVAVVGIAYALYKHFSPKYVEDFEDDFEDFDDDFFDDETV